MKLCTAVQEGCGYKETLSAHRYFVPLAKYFTVCITYQPNLVCGHKYWHLMIVLHTLPTKDHNRFSGFVLLYEPEFMFVRYLTNRGHFTEKARWFVFPLQIIQTNVKEDSRLSHGRWLPATFQFIGLATIWCYVVRYANSVAQEKQHGENGGVV